MTDLSDAPAAITTSETLESGSTLVQSIDPVTGIVTQTPTPTQGSVIADAIEGEVTSSSAPQAVGTEQASTTVVSVISRVPVSELSPEGALAWLRAHVQALHTVVGNIANVAEIDFKSIDAEINAISGHVAHLKK
jgi:hypothetical protein